MKETEKISVLNNGNCDEERNDGIYEKFWKVSNPQIFAEKMLSQRSARKYFRSEGLYKDFYCKTNESVKIDFKSKDKLRKYIKGEAKKKNILEVIAQKDIRRIKHKIMCKYIRAIILQRKDCLSIEESTIVWMHCSGSQDQMRQNQQYYKKILQQENFDNSDHQIKEDLKRSKALVKSEDYLDQMYRIFTAYARRNAYIGYCQGLNYIVAKFLNFKMSEEESFWLLVQLLENILPLDYYPSMMMGIVCDQKIFELILNIENEKLSKKLQTFEVNVINILLTQWIVCLFTQALDDSLLLIAWNHIFTKGSITIFKVCLIMINYCEKEIMKAQGLEVVKEIENKLRNWKDTKKFRKQLEKIYINEKGINFMREFYKQICVIQLKQRQDRRKNNRQIDLQKLQCNPSYPTCKFVIAQEEIISSDNPPEYFIFRTDVTFIVDWDYFKTSKINDKRNVSIGEDEDIMQTKHVHICPQYLQQIQSKLQEQQLIVEEQQQNIIINEQQNIIINEQIQNIIINEQIQMQNQQDIKNITIQQEKQEQIQNPQLDEGTIISNELEQEQDQVEESKQQQIDIDELREQNSQEDSTESEYEPINTESVSQQQELSYAETHKNEDNRYSSDSNVEPNLYFKREELDNSNSFRFFSDITKKRNKFNYLITNKNNLHHSEITKVIEEVQSDIIQDS